MNVRWSERAATEFAETIAYITREFGQKSAQKVSNQINNAIANISNFPEIGAVSFFCEETEIEFRELHSYLNSVVYAIHCDEIYIVSIWSNRQDRDDLYFALRQESKDL
ncbi:MAG: type II toxin-antitoxin system RelE/ParE family toxin [Bacteroidales bacterium]|nr:type II toxin-antitoxin system RelE/ParE family toxin [Bacteroidales bacterium]